MWKNYEEKVNTENISINLKNVENAGEILN